MCDRFVGRDAVQHFFTRAVRRDFREFGAHGSGAERTHPYAAIPHFGCECERKAQHVGFRRGVDGKISERRKRSEACRVDDERSLCHVRERYAAKAGERRAVQVYHIEFTHDVGFRKGTVGTEARVIDKDVDSKIAPLFFKQLCKTFDAFAPAYVHADGAGDDAFFRFDFFAQRIEPFFSSRDEPEFVALFLPCDLEREFFSHAGTRSGDDADFFHAFSINDKRFPGNSDSEYAPKFNKGESLPLVRTSLRTAPSSGDTPQRPVGSAFRRSCTRALY